MSNRIHLVIATKGNEDISGIVRGGRRRSHTPSGSVMNWNGKLR